MTFEYNHNDKIECGDMKPKIEGNVNTNLNWKGFNLYMLFKYQYGGKIYNATLASKVEGVNPLKNADKRVLYDVGKNRGIMRNSDVSTIRVRPIRQPAWYLITICWLCKVSPCHMSCLVRFPRKCIWKE